jgi:hypothetical protein
VQREREIPIAAKLTEQCDRSRSAEAARLHISFVAIHASNKHEGEGGAAPIVDLLG